MKPTIRQSVEEALRVLDDYAKRGILHADSFTMDGPNAWITSDILNNAISSIWIEEGEDLLARVNARENLTHCENVHILNSGSEHPSMQVHPMTLSGFFTSSRNKDGIDQLIFSPPENDTRRYLDIDAIRAHVRKTLEKIETGWELSRTPDGALFFTKTLDSGTAHVVSQALDGWHGILPSGDIKCITRYQDGVVNWEKELTAEKACILGCPQGEETIIELNSMPKLRSLEEWENEEPTKEEITQWRAQLGAKATYNNAQEKAKRHQANYPGGSNLRPLRRLEEIDLELGEASLETVDTVRPRQPVESRRGIGLVYLVIPATEPVKNAMEQWGVELPPVPSLKILQPHAPNKHMAAVVDLTNRDWTARK